MVVGTLTCREPLYSVYDLKAAQINVKSSHIRELMRYRFELGHNAAETTMLYEW